MQILEKLAERLSPTRFGRWAMDATVGSSRPKSRPSVRTGIGIAMIALSFVVGVPGVVVCGFIARKYQAPMILVLGGSAAMVINYLLFGTGIYLAGGNYASILLRRGARKFLTRFGK